jgi:hypothetical protein
VPWSRRCRLCVRRAPSDLSWFSTALDVSVVFFIVTFVVKTTSISSKQSPGTRAAALHGEGLTSPHSVASFVWKNRLRAHRRLCLRYSALLALAAALIALSRIDRRLAFGIWVRFHFVVGCLYSGILYHALGRLASTTSTSTTTWFQLGFLLFQYLPGVVVIAFFVLTMLYYSLRLAAPRPLVGRYFLRLLGAVLPTTTTTYFVAPSTRLHTS